MSEVTIQGLDRRDLNEVENHALDILLNLPLANFNQIKQRLELDVPGVVGRTTLDKFIAFCQQKGLDLSEAGVNAFKDANGLGNTGLLRGVIGPQTAGIYFDVLMSVAPPPSGGRRINDAGLELVKEFEGLHSRTFRSGPRRGQLVPNGGVTAYFDPVRVPTIGWGNIDSVTASDVDVKVITLLEAENLLRSDLASAEDAVSHLITVPLNDNEFSALVSFTFNLGAGALQDSTLRKRLNRGDNRVSIANDEFRKWVRAGGRELPGLVRRRKAERDLFLS
ncbi:MAG: lysozyme [Microcystis aeruginosa F13-15]|nr:lysozyme [Microcystis aeruginosa F13-15]